MLWSCVVFHSMARSAFRSVAGFKAEHLRHARGTVWRAPTIDVPLSPSILGSLITLCTAWPLLVIDHLLMRWPIMRVCPCGPFQCNLLIREGKKLERHMTPSVTGQVSVGFFFIPGLRGNLSTSGQIDLLSAVCPTSVVRSSISSPLHSRGLVGDD